MSETISRTKVLALCDKAGVTKDEIEDHPEHGVVVSLSGMIKLARLAPQALIEGRLMEALAAIDVEMEARDDD